MYSCPRLGILILCCSCSAFQMKNETEGDEIPESYTKLSTSNTLWTNLLKNCKRPTTDCVKDNVFVFLDSILQHQFDLKVTDAIVFRKNDLDYDNITKESDSKIDEDVVKERSSPFEEIVVSLHDKAAKFMMTHDLDILLPSYFDGATLRFSPKTFEGGGAIFKADIIPGQGRIFFKKIKKFISDKLLMALLAVILIVKLIAVKVLFFMPMIMGVAAAKKLLLKVILFIFPALSHLFKLCPYYEPSKLHHHQHHISHIHHLPTLHHGINLDHLPIKQHYHSSHDQPLDYYSEGPGVSEYKRKNFEINAQLYNDEKGVVGLGQGQTSLRRGTQQVTHVNKHLTPAEIENMISKAEQETTLKARLQEERRRVEAENRRLQEQIKQLVKVQEKLKLQSVILKQNSKLVAANMLQSANIIHSPSIPPSALIQPPQMVHAIPAVPSYQQPTYVQPPIVQALPIYQIPQSNPAPLASTPVSNVFINDTFPVYDQFYSPILEKIDKILTGLGFSEEACRERLICSMYKNPTKFSPHSNLLSAELSRDENELQKPTSTNTAVVRFYKYVQAARDGQEKRNCIRLYPMCAVNTDT